MWVARIIFPVEPTFPCLAIFPTDTNFPLLKSDVKPIEAVATTASFAVSIFCVVSIDFIGKKSLLEQKKNGLKKIFAGFICDDPDQILLGRETIFRDGKQVGWLSSGGYGYTIGKSIGYGYIRSEEVIDKEFVKSGNYELEIATKKVPCNIHLSSMYDAKMEKIKS